MCGFGVVVVVARKCIVCGRSDDVIQCQWVGFGRSRVGQTRYWSSDEWNGWEGFGG